jgi:hypothetical protein
MSASTSVLTLLGHKEDMLAHRAATRLASSLGGNVVVCCGIHVDAITKVELKFIDEAVDRFCRWLSDEARGRSRKKARGRK